ncbi:MAG TPA: trypsin-like serine protease [Bellilinea sp.]|nr:trypsin-like serine protease [Bellilinea sp.]
MKRIFFAAVIVLSLVFSFVETAQAVTDGELDGEGHPYVGLLVAQDAAGNALWRCSGTLIAPKLFLTAGHCTEFPAAHVEIWFDADVTDAVAQNYPFVGDVGGTPYTHPLYNPNAFFLHDLGVAVLDKPVKMDVYGALPALEVLTALNSKRGQQDVTFTAVGYGLQMSFPDAASWKEHNVRVRMVATPHLLQIDTGFVGDFSLLLSNNANTGGTCFGDSGGPNFIGSSNVLAGVTSFGLNGTCGGTGGVYRVDKADDLDWLYGSFARLLR